jgi:hypothetical protein
VIVDGYGVAVPLEGREIDVELLNVCANVLVPTIRVTTLTSMSTTSRRHGVLIDRIAASNRR